METQRPPTYSEAVGNIRGPQPSPGNVESNQVAASCCRKNLFEDQRSEEKPKKFKTPKKMLANILLDSICTCVLWSSAHPR